jgi:hypothetical protein
MSAVSAALKALMSLAIFQAGKTAQAQKDDAAALKDDADARKVHNEVAAMSPEQLDAALERVRQPAPNK